MKTEGKCQKSNKKTGGKKAGQVLSADNLVSPRQKAVRSVCKDGIGKSVFLTLIRNSFVAVPFDVLC